MNEYIASWLDTSPLDRLAIALISRQDGWLESSESLGACHGKRLATLGQIYDAALDALVFDDDIVAIKFPSVPKA